jgi:LPS O-antigen subunit length determinant protein (WzzB/FepE family)
MNNLSSFFAQKKTIIIEAAVLTAVVIGMLYAYSIFTSEDATVTQPAINQQLLGQNFILFLKAVNQDKVSLRETAFLNTTFVAQLQDFSETISPTASRGRSDPFTPYASSRPIR